MVRQQPLKLSRTFSSLNSGALSIFMSGLSPIDAEVVAALCRLLDVEPRRFIEQVQTVRHDEDGFTCFLDGEGGVVVSVPTHYYDSLRAYGEKFSAES